MAIYETALSGRRGAVIGPGWARQKIVITAAVAMTTAMLNNADDDVGLFNVPAGFVVTGITAAATDLDTGSAAALRIDIGDAGDEDRLIAAGAFASTGALTTALAVSGFLYKYSAQTQIRAYVQAAATTAAAGTLYVALEGFVDPNFNRTGIVATAT